MNLLLEVQWGQFILLGVLVLVLIASPFFMKARNKKETEMQQKMMDNLKKGDTVLTYAGVIGKIVGIENKDGYKTVTLETGNEKHKGYMCVDIASVYSNLSNPVVPEYVKKDEPKVEEEKPIEAPEHLEEQPAQAVEESEKVEEAKEEVKEEKQEKKAKSKKSKK